MATNTPNGDKGDGNGSKKPSAEQHHIAVAINSLKEKYEAAQAHRADHERDVLRWTRIAGIGVGIYAALTVVIMCAAIYAAKQAKVSADAAERAASEAKRQADGMQDQVVVAKDGEQRQLRAYVYVAPTVESFEISQTPVMNVIIRAIGQTPAYNVRGTVRGAMTNIPLLPDKTLEKENVKVITGDKAILFPGTTDNLTIPYAVDQNANDPMYTEIKKGTASRLWVTGQVTYQDAFGCNHRLRYCIGLGGSDMTPKECEDRNESDDPGQCDKKN